MNCRFDHQPLTHLFADLGYAPPSNAFLDPEDLHRPETHFPLRLFVSERSWLVQTADYHTSEQIFTKDYVYFSSYSRTWLAHSRRYVEEMTARFGYGPASQVVEIASNDGYLLQYFKEKGIPVLGIEPTESTATVARSKGIESWTEFFGVSLAQKLVAQGRQADLLLGNNVLAHVPDLNDFVAGLQLTLKPEGVVTMEFPHLMQLVAHNQFDTIYHEHFSYFSLLAVQQVFARHGLRIFDVQELPTHGGSLRIFAAHTHSAHQPCPAIEALLAKEKALGMDTLAYYQGFQAKIDQVKLDFLSFLTTQKKAGKKTGAYGAAAKGNTLLNYCGVRPDLLPWVVDASPYKQGKLLPGSHIPVMSEAVIRQERPDFVVILPWNIREEIMAQLSYIREWGGQFVVAVPELMILK